MKKKIAVGGISTECSTYSSLIQTEKDFKTIKDKELLDLLDYPFNKDNFKILPIFLKKSIPGGPIDFKYFNLITHEFVSFKDKNSITFPHKIFINSKKINLVDIISFFQIFENIFSKNHLDNINIKIPINYINFKNIIIKEIKSLSND